jgi:hypothetical protein
MGQLQAFLHDGDQHVGADGAPYLRLHGVSARSQERLDPQVPLDPLEKEFHIPTALVERGDAERGQRGVVGHKDQGLARLGVLESNSSKLLGIILFGVVTDQHDALIADQTGTSVHGHRVHAPSSDIAFGSGHEERVRLMQRIEPLEVEVASIHDVERTRLGQALFAQDVQHIDIVQLAIADGNETWDQTSQVQQSMELDGGIQIDCQRLAGVQRPSNADEVLSEVGEGLPWPHRIGIGQRVARHGLAAKPHVIEPMTLGAQIHFDVVQRSGETWSAADGS